MLQTERAIRARERSRVWRENNRERHREYTRQYRRDHTEETARKNREWAQSNPERMRAYHRKSRAKNPNSYRETHRKYWAKNPGLRRLWCANRRARLRASGGVVTVEQWERLKARYGNVCLCCQRPSPLTLDHVIPISLGGQHEIGNIQPLCLRCNSAKGTRTTDYRGN